MSIATSVSDLEVTIEELRSENQSLRTSLDMSEAECRHLTKTLDSARAERDALMTRHAEAMTILRQTCAGLVEGLRRADETEKRRAELTNNPSGLPPVAFVPEAR